MLGELSGPFSTERKATNVTLESMLTEAVLAFQGITYDFPEGTKETHEEHQPM
jgi:hypothetical protein